MAEITLTIKLSDNGQINVNGPIDNKTLCYGMLEVAKDAIRDHVAKNSQVIIPARAIPTTHNGN